MVQADGTLRLELIFLYSASGGGCNGQWMMSDAIRWYDQNISGIAALRICSSQHCSRVAGRPTSKRTSVGAGHRRRDRSTAQRIVIPDLVARSAAVMDTNCRV